MHLRLNRSIVDMRMRLCFLLIFALISTCVHGHVRLTFPPARGYDLDFLDNYRNYGPCGMRRYPGDPVTTFVEGARFEVTWHVAYTHRGGIKFDLLRGADTSDFHVVSQLTPSYYIYRNDTTKQSLYITLPSGLHCPSCTLRLTREASEWGGTYAFWSCADISIIPRPNNTRSFETDSLPEARGYSTSQFLTTPPSKSPFLDCFEGKCLHGGSCNDATGLCECRNLFSGERCQFKDECWSDEDCNGQGQCIDTRSTTFPKLLCYCRAGWYGTNCNKESQITEVLEDYSSDPNYLGLELSPSNAYLYWRYLNNFTEIEIALRVRSTSWIGVGWRPFSITNDCKNLDPIDSFRATLQDDTHSPLKKINLGISTASPHLDPELAIENQLTSNIEERCNGGSNSLLEQIGELESSSEPEPSAEPEPSGEPESYVEPEIYTEPEPDTNDYSYLPLWLRQAIGTSPVDPQSGQAPRPRWFLEYIGQVEPQGEPVPEPLPVPEWFHEFLNEYYAQPEPDHQTDPHGEPEPSSEPEPYVEPEIYTEPEPSIDNYSHLPLWLRQAFGVSRVEPESEPEPRPRWFLEYIGQVEPQGEPVPEPLPVPEWFHEFVNGYYAQPEPDHQTDPHGEPEPSTTPEPSLEPETEPQYKPKPTTTSRNINALRNLAITHAMDCADIVIGSVKGNLYRVQDLYTRDRSTPRTDAFYGGNDDITSAIGSQVDGFTTIVFRKKTQATHYTDHSILPEPMHLIWAKGQEINTYVHVPDAGLEICSASDSRFYRHDEIKYHGTSREQRGVTTVLFARPMVSEDVCDTEAGSFKFPQQCIETDNNYNCQYLVRWSLANDIITFTVKVMQSRGNYVAIGISDNRNMPQSDIYTGWITENGEVVVKDRWAAGYFTPEIDDIQDAFDISGSYENGITTIQFSRKRNTHKPATDFSFTDTECRHLLLAEGPLAFDGSDITYHTFKRILTSNKLCIRQCNPVDQIDENELDEEYVSTQTTSFAQADETIRTEAEKTTTTTTSTTLSAVPSRAVEVDREHEVAEEEENYDLGRGCSTENGVINTPQGCNSNISGFNCESSIRWSLRENDTIIFTVRARQSLDGYIALGISANRVMPRSDIYSAWFNQNGFTREIILRDRWAGTHFRPSFDRLENAFDVKGKYQDGVMTIQFSRARDTEDNRDLSFSNTKCRHLLFAQGPVIHKDISYHTIRRVVTEKKVCIRPCATKGQKAPSTQSIVTTNEATFPQTATTQPRSHLQTTGSVDNASVTSSAAASAQIMFFQGSFYVINFYMGRTSSSDDVSLRLRRMRAILQQQIMKTFSYSKIVEEGNAEVTVVKVMSVRRKGGKRLQVTFNGNLLTKLNNTIKLQEELLYSFKAAIKDNDDFLYGNEHVVDTNSIDITAHSGTTDTSTDSYSTVNSTISATTAQTNLLTMVPIFGGTFGSVMMIGYMLYRKITV